MKMILCRPCAEKEKEIKTLKKVSVASRKDTCQNCGRRRFCLLYAVEDS